MALPTPFRRESANVHFDGRVQIDDPALGHRIIKTTVNYDDTSPVNIGDVKDGDIVTAVIVEITTAWNGNGTINLGDGGDTDGHMASAKVAMTATGFKGDEADDGGAYLYDAGNAHLRKKIYEAADTVDATLVVGTSTQGVAVCYVHVTRLKN